jgi:ComF family protein
MIKGKYLTNNVKKFFSFVIDLVYPPICPSCNRIYEDKVGSICVNCWSSLQYFNGDYTSEVLKESRYFNDLRILYNFDSKLQTLIHLMKYKRYCSLGVRLGQEFYKRFKGENIFSVHCVVPVPLHLQKYRERGYNQSELIARGICQSSLLPLLPKLLKRKRYTRSQTKLNVEDRVMNVSGAFIVDRKIVRELRVKHILLVDDVITTGSTLNECARILTEEGVESVKVAAIATPPA